MYIICLEYLFQMVKCSRNSRVRGSKISMLLQWFNQPLVSSLASIGCDVFTEQVQRICVVLGVALWLRPWENRGHARLCPLFFFAYK